MARYHNFFTQVQVRAEPDMGIAASRPAATTG